MANKERVIEILKTVGALQEGHFRLTSGRHSDRYFQCAKIFQEAQYSEELCAALAEKFKDAEVDLVIGPAIGAVIMSYEMGRQLGVRNIFAERENGAMSIRRGFFVPQGARVLVVEDVVTTGGSVREVIDLVRETGGEVIGVGSIVDRTGGKIDFGVPYASVVSFDVVSYEEEECPLCKQGLPIVKPGSRQISK